METQKALACGPLRICRSLRAGKSKDYTLPHMVERDDYAVYKICITFVIFCKEKGHVFRINTLLYGTESSPRSGSYF
jgi:hypothetical protein